MSVTFRVTFPLGRYHGTQWGRDPGDGICDWPPSPWRVLRSLYSGWRFGADHIDEQEGSALLSKLMATQPTYLVPAHRAAHSRHYYPLVNHRSVAEPGKSTTLTQDPFVVIDRDAGGCPMPLYIEWAADLANDEVQHLGEICGAVGYLGRADSVCEIEVAADAPAEGERGGYVRFVPGDGPGAIDLLSPTPDTTVDELVLTVPYLREKLGDPTPPTADSVRYRPAMTSSPKVRSRVDYNRKTGFNAVRFVLTSRKRPQITQALTVGEISRSAARSRYTRLRERLIDEGSDADLAELHPGLTGKAPDGARATSDHSHAHFFAYSIEGPANDAAEVDTVVAFAPGTFDVAAMQALNSIRRIWAPDHVKSIQGDTRLVIEAAGLIDDIAPELVGPATTWISHTPFSAIRRQKRMDWDDFIADSVRREMRGRPWLAEHADTVAIEVLSDDVRRHRRHRISGDRDLRSPRRGCRVRLHFESSVTGPIALGRHAHIGLGLFLPVPD